MEQESIYKNIAIIGAGAAGGFAAVLLCKNPYNKVTIFDEKEPFTTLLPTGGGRCNITNSQKDIREFVKNYPRGEKFLLSVLNKLDSTKTRTLFKDLGIKTYVQEDGRVFPSSDSSKKVQQVLSSHLAVNHIKENVISVEKVEDAFVVRTNSQVIKFDYVILATGGKGNGFELAKSLGHKIVDPRPSLCALDINEKSLFSLSGLSFKNVEATVQLKKKITVVGDMLFTHKSLSGPVIFKVSAQSAYEEFNKEKPLSITLKLVDISVDEIEDELKNNSKKTIKNVFSKFAPESYISKILEINKIDGNKQTAQIKKSEKETLINALISLKVDAIGRIKDSEIVTAGGVDLDEINAKTMESKLVDKLYFVGEMLNIDAYTGGYNLQNCWSTAYVCSMALN